MDSRSLNLTPYVVFRLIPTNRLAYSVVCDPRNHQHLSCMGDDAFDVYFNPQQASGITCTIGRTGHIIIDRIGISNIQCSFQVHLETGEIMLIDQSPSQNCRLGSSNVPFGAAVVDREVNNRFSFGGRGRHRYEFRIEFCINPPIDMIAWKSVWSGIMWSTSSARDGRLGQTGTVRDCLPVRRLSRPANHRERFRDRSIIADEEEMSVSVAVDLCTGQYVAVKTVKYLDYGNRHHLVEEASVELTSFRHNHIIEFLQVEIHDTHFDLVMDLQDGDVDTLSQTSVYQDVRDPLQGGDTIGLPLLHQMLQALDYLTVRNIIHRDVKPKNILFRQAGPSFHYRLADFGIATPVLAATHPSFYNQRGTPLFEAPEVVFWDHSQDQTTKIDIWSLCATLVWAFDLGDFQCYSETPGNCPDMMVVASIGTIARSQGGWFARMAELDPEDRISAGELLDGMFGGQGRVSSPMALRRRRE
ncbi:hypothetical protein FGRMN_6626 [Fusarium graminum]|nr:hypothetical protein FGRMN_6626 [Fusarium graminum]